MSAENLSLFGIYEMQIDERVSREQQLIGGNHSKIRILACLEHEEAGWINVLRLPEGVILRNGEKSEGELTPLTPSFIDRYGHQAKRLHVKSGSYLVGYFHIEKIAPSTPFAHYRELKT